MRTRHSTTNRRWLHIEGRLALALLCAIARPSAATAEQMLATSAARIPLRYQIPAVAIAAALAAEGLAIAPERLHLPVPLSSASPAPALHVAGAEMQQDGSLLLRVICRNAGECMPFFATVTTADRTAALVALAGMHAPGAAATAGNTAAALTPAAPATHPRGITVGTHITLELTDAQMRIHLPAVAIDTGAPGSEVRVASLDRKHTYRGIVVDANTVQGGMQ